LGCRSTDNGAGDSLQSAHSCQEEEYNYRAIILVVNIKTIVPNADHNLKIDEKIND
jgi:hypothetical protein